MTVSEAVEPARAGGSDRVFKWVAVVVGVCLVGFVLFVVLRGPSHPSSRSSSALAVGPPPVLPAGTVAPPFSLPPQQGGQPVTLASYRGTPVIVNFFASWCPDCRQELAAMASAAKSAAGRVVVLGVDSNESSNARSEQLLKAAHAVYPVGLDAKATVASAYLVDALPITYFIDAQGRVVGAAQGPQTVSSLRRWVARLERAR